MPLLHSKCLSLLRSHTHREASMPNYYCNLSGSPSGILLLESSPPLLASSFRRELGPSYFLGLKALVQRPKFRLAKLDLISCLPSWRALMGSRNICKVSSKFSDYYFKIPKASTSGCLLPSEIFASPHTGLDLNGCACRSLGIIAQYIDADDKPDIASRLLFSTRKSRKANANLRLEIIPSPPTGHDRYHWSMPRGPE